MSDSAILALQTLLKEVGHDPGPVDGLRGPRTEAAARGYLAAAAPATGGWDARSEANLRGVHPDLVRVAARVRQISPVRFIVIEGLRTPERQRQLVASGASQTLNSRHLTGHAIDIVRWMPPARSRGTGRSTTSSRPR